MSNYVEALFGIEAFSAPKPIILQRTELGRYAICPHQANLCEQLAEEIETHDILPETGKIVHAIAKTAIESNGRNLQEAADYIAEELPKARPDLQPEALRAGRNLANEIRRFAGSQVLLCDEPVSRSLMPATQDKGEVLVVCEPDLVLASTKADTIIVPDYKTGYKQRTSQEALDDFQTCVGSWILFGKFQTVNIIHWFYLNTRKFTRSYCRIERERDEANFETRIFETVRIKLDGCDDAWPEPEKCAQCPVVNKCQEAQYAECRMLADNPQSYFDSYITLQAVCGEMLKAMKAYVKNGRVIYGTKARFAFEPKPKYLPKIHKGNGEEPEQP